MFKKLIQDKKVVRNISTEDLYLCTIKVAKVKKNGEVYFEDKKYILAKKINFRYFQDILDGHLYKYDPFYFTDGELYVRYSLPVISRLKHISYNEAISIINEKNAIKEETKNKILIKK